MAAEMEAERKRAAAPQAELGALGEDVSNKRLKLDVGNDETTKEKVERENSLPKEIPQEQASKTIHSHKRGKGRNDGRGNNTRDRAQEDGDDQSQRLPVSLLVSILHNLSLTSLRFPMP